MSSARREFARHGIVKARIEDITAACGLSKGAFYLHFESKEALFRELCTVLETEFGALSTARETAYAELIAATKPSKRKMGAPDLGDFIGAMAEIDAREDHRLLELLWEWRDVTDVLLRGSQGTEFESVMWTMLDREVERVMAQCQGLERVRLVRADVPPEVVGMMIVGTYLLVARRMTQLKVKPDFEHWVRSLQSLIASGISTLPEASLPKLPVRKKRTA